MVPEKFYEIRYRQARSRPPSGQFHHVHSFLGSLQSAESTLDPEDISLGGFKVVVPNQPRVGDVIKCYVKLKGKRYENCRAQVAWVSEKDSDHSSWEVGVALDMEEDERAGFHSDFIEVLKEMGKSP
ncbi:MAG: PilZ domain-containing protein [Nitrospinota bacterium]|jgi:hypothetical protein|nr:PilZ domain-containing protein [Nitrospinota bacterium]MEE1551179.1 PilZ domain-containing protein [Nitrospinaceae bacterium]